MSKNDILKSKLGKIKYMPVVLILGLTLTACTSGVSIEEKEMLDSKIYKLEKELKMKNENMDNLIVIHKGELADKATRIETLESTISALRKNTGIVSTGTSVLIEESEGTKTSVPLVKSDLRDDIIKQQNHLLNLGVSYEQLNFYFDDFNQTLTDAVTFIRDNIDGGYFTLRHEKPEGIYTFEDGSAIGFLKEWHLVDYGGERLTIVKLKELMKPYFTEDAIEIIMNKMNVLSKETEIGRSPYGIYDGYLFIKSDVQAKTISNQVYMDDAIFVINTIGKDLKYLEMTSYIPVESLTQDGGSGKLTFIPMKLKVRMVEDKWKIDSVFDISNLIE